MMGGDLVGVYIKGMKIPENCIACPMQFGGWCYVSPPEIDERVAPTVDEAAEQGKPEWCPLVDLGKHGRLIDADALDYRLGASDRDIYVKYTVEEEPTVIEAEDGT